MQDEDTINIIKKAKLVYWLFFLLIVAIRVSMSIGRYVLVYDLIVIFLTVGVLSFIYYDRKMDNWANDHLLWQRNSFIVMVIGGLIVILSGYLSANVNIAISTLYINHAFILSILIVIALSFAVWFLYRFVAGVINFFNRLSPYESKKKT